MTKRNRMVTARFWHHRGSVILTPERRTGQPQGLKGKALMKALNPAQEAARPIRVRRPVTMAEWTIRGWNRRSAFWTRGRACRCARCWREWN